MKLVPRWFGAASPAALDGKTLPAELSAVTDFLAIANIGDVLTDRHGLAIYRLYMEMIATCEGELKGTGVKSPGHSILVRRNLIAIVTALAERYPR